MKNVQNFVFAITIFALLLCVQVIFSQNNRIQYLQDTLKITEKSKEIEEDFVRDLMYQLNNAKMELNNISDKHYVAGVVDAINKPDVYTSIWHEGYNRGVNVQRYTEEAKYTTLKDGE